MPEGLIEDEDDIFIESLDNALFLGLGVLSVFASLILLVHSATVVVYGQQLRMDFLYTSIVAVLFFVLGSGSLHVFQKRRKLRKSKKTALFLR